jgi:hypothetical protein
VAGQYRLQFILPAGYVFSPPNQGSDDSLNSDADGSGNTLVFELASDANDLTRDAGMYTDIPTPRYSFSPSDVETQQSNKLNIDGGRYMRREYHGSDM